MPQAGNGAGRTRSLSQYSNSRYSRYQLSSLSQFIFFISGDLVSSKKNYFTKTRLFTLSLLDLLLSNSQPTKFYPDYKCCSILTVGGFLSRLCVRVSVCVCCPQELFKLENPLYKLKGNCYPELAPGLMSVYELICHSCSDSQ